MSSATIDRALQNAKGNGQKVRRRGVAGSELRRSVPIRTFSDWGDAAPGHMEADLVSHSGPVAKGSWAWTLTLTDIATGWTECAPLLVREQTLLVEVLKELRKLMPFPLLGFDSDNDSVFINETVRDYCATTEIAFTRCRPYRKNDQAWVEQKNGRWCAGTARACLVLDVDNLFDPLEMCWQRSAVGLARLLISRSGCRVARGTGLAKRRLECDNLGGAAPSRRTGVDWHLADDRHDRCRNRQC